MVVGVTLFVIAILVIGIYLLVELKRLRHKLFAILLIGLIIFTYISFSVVVKNQSLNFKTIPGVIQAGKVYFFWLGSIFGNLKSITGYAVDMDWGGNETKTK